jgi:hypothetical protein
VILLLAVYVASALSLIHPLAKYQFPMGNVVVRLVPSALLAGLWPVWALWLLRNAFLRRLLSDH